MDLGQFLDSESLKHLSKPVETNATNSFNRIFFGGSSFSVQLEGCVNHSVQAAADYLTQVRKGCIWDPEETEIGEKRNRNLMQNLVGLITVLSKYVNTSHEFVLKRY